MLPAGALDANRLSFLLFSGPALSRLFQNTSVALGFFPSFPPSTERTYVDALVWP